MTWGRLLGRFVWHRLRPGELLSRLLTIEVANPRLAERTIDVDMIGMAQHGVGVGVPAFPLLQHAHRVIVVQPNAFMNGAAVPFVASGRMSSSCAGKAIGQVFRSNSIRCGNSHAPRARSYFALCPCHGASLQLVEAQYHHHTGCAKSATHTTGHNPMPWPVLVCAPRPRCRCSPVGGHLPGPRGLSFPADRFGRRVAHGKFRQRQGKVIGADRFGKDRRATGMLCPARKIVWPFLRARAAVPKRP